MIGDKLLALLESKKIKPGTLARLIGVPKSTIYSIIKRNNKNVDFSVIEKISETLDVPIEYFYDSQPNVPAAPAAPELTAPPASFFTREVVRIPVLGRIPAGIPIEAIEDVLDFEEIPAAMAAGGREYFALMVRGVSMAPDFLDGDIVIVRKTDICESGDVCVVYVNGSDATLKEVQLDPKNRTLTIVPRNPIYDARTFSAEEIELLPVRIGGVVEDLRRRPAKRER